MNIVYVTNNQQMSSRFLPALVRVVVVTATLLFMQPVQAEFSQIISIGDSLSDSGNTNDITLGTIPDSNYYFGRFSNGPVWNEQLAVELGLAAPTPSRSGGFNYAYGGALTSQDYVEVIIPIIFVITLPSATSQLFDFLADVSNNPDPDALYTVSIGGNDILDAGAGLSATPTTSALEIARQEMRDIAGSLEVALQQLLDDLTPGGEARIILMNAPNVGVTPRASLDGKQFVYEQLSIAYNEGLANVVTSLNDQRVLLVDFFALTSDVVNSPSSYGLANVSDRCYNEALGSICANPVDYLFWDDIHPTAIGHSLLMMQVQEAMQADEVDIPIPAFYSWLLLFMFAVSVTGTPALRCYRPGRAS